MFPAHILLVAISVVSLTIVQAQAEDKNKEKEPSAILEIGGAIEGSFQDRIASFGPTVAVEVTPIENWLEIEAGITPLFSHGQTEVDTDLLFKKPFTLSKTVEFMVGAGPEWVHRSGSDSIAGEVALDFMFWPTKDRKFGWFLEPSYSYDFGRGHEQSLGASVGLLIPIP